MHILDLLGVPFPALIGVEGGNSHLMHSYILVPYLAHSKSLINIGSNYYMKYVCEGGEQKIILTNSLWSSLLAGAFPVCTHNPVGGNRIASIVQMGDRGTEK